MSRGGNRGKTNYDDLSDNDDVDEHKIRGGNRSGEKGAANAAKKRQYEGKGTHFTRDGVYDWKDALVDVADIPSFGLAGGLSEFSGAMYHHEGEKRDDAGPRGGRRQAGNPNNRKAETTSEEDKATAGGVAKKFKNTKGKLSSDLVAQVEDNNWDTHLLPNHTQKGYQQVTKDAAAYDEEQLQKKKEKNKADFEEAKKIKNKLDDTLDNVKKQGEKATGVSYKEGKKMIKDMYSDPYPIYPEQYPGGGGFAGSDIQNNNYNNVTVENNIDLGALAGFTPQQYGSSQSVGRSDVDTRAHMDANNTLL